MYQEMKLLGWEIIAAFFLLMPLAHASDAYKNSPQEILIDATHLIPSQILPFPPELDGPIGKSELAEIKIKATHANSKERELAAKDDVTKNVSFFSDTIKGFDIEKLPKTKALFNQVRRTEQYVAKKFKSYFIRNRPYVNDIAIKPCISPKISDRNTSYPSGHAVMGFSMGVVLSQLIPEKSAAIMHRANVYAENRLICGLHHRSDISAGQVLGTLVAVQLLQNHEFQKMLLLAKQELINAGLTKEQ